MATSSIPQAVLAELERQMNHELSACYGYLATSVWCEAHNFKGCAAFFLRQSDEEREHADKIIQHLVDRGAKVAFGALPAPRQDFPSLSAVAANAQAMEQANTRGIHAVYEAALAAKDFPTQVLMHWFINEQVEEEAWAAAFIAHVESASCAGSLSSLDRHIVSLLTEDAAKD